MSIKKLILIIFCCLFSMQSYANEYAYNQLDRIYRCKAIYIYNNDINKSNAIIEKALPYAQQVLPMFKHQLIQAIGNETMPKQYKFMLEDEFLLGYLMGSLEHSLKHETLASIVLLGEEKQADSLAKKYSCYNF